MNKQNATLELDGGCATHKEKGGDMPLFASPVKHNGQSPKRYQCTELGFQSFDLDHPEIWREFERVTLALIDGGKRHFSADSVLHYIRFDSALNGGEEFKINNNWSAFYSRKFTRQHPEHKWFFEQRERKHI